MTWFRLDDDVVNDPKVQRLSGDLFKAWVNLLCLASKGKGFLPDVRGIAFSLRTSVSKTEKIVGSLVEAGLIERSGEALQPHNWAGRQFQSDSSAERVRRHREKRAANGLQRQWSAPKELREAIYTRDQFQCVYCQSTDDLTIDHRTPESRGGTHDIENLQVACRYCNAAKRDMTHDEFVTRNGGVTLQKRHQNTEQNTTEQTDSALRAPATNGKYAFVAGVIKLNDKDLAQFVEAYSYLDVKAELLSLSDWAADQANWFHAVKGALAKRNRDVKARQSKPDKPEKPPHLEGIL